MPTKQLPTLIHHWYSDSGIIYRYNTVFNGSRTGTANSGWRQRIKTGAQAGSPMTSDRFFEIQADNIDAHIVHKRYVNDTTVDVVRTSSPNGWGLNTGQGDFGHNGTSLSASDEAQALSRIYARVRQEAYGFNGLLVLGELKETIHMLRHPLSALEKGLSTYLTTLKSTRKQVGATVLRRKSETDKALFRRRYDAVRNAMSGSWLELQFGIKPLINDVKDIAATALDLATGPSVKKARIRAKSTDVKNVYNVSAVYPGSFMTEILVVKQAITYAGIQYICGLTHSLDAPVSQLERVVSASGFQIQNFAPTIYELIPWSFLIDYFVNLGEIIEAVCTDTSDVKWVVRTERYDTTTTYTEKWTPYSDSPIVGYPRYICTSATGTFDAILKVRHLTVTRTTPATLPWPPLVVSVPGTDSSKWFNMAALLAQSSKFRFR